MTPMQTSRREALIARSDAALERWPDRIGPEFAAEMGAVAQGLEDLAHAADRAGNHRDALERSQIWRYAGNAWFDLGAGRDREKLEYAASAYRSAEEALAEVHDAVELIKLNYCYGNTLLKLSEGKDLKLASAARARLAAALDLARVHMPSGAAPLEEELRNAEQIVALLREADGLEERIDQLRREVRHSEQPRQHPVEAADASAADSDKGEFPLGGRTRSAKGETVSALFGALRQEFERERPALEPTRQVGLADFMERLEAVVTRGSSENSLEDMIANRGRLDGLVRELHAQIKKPSLAGPGAPVDSRNQSILAALLELKSFFAAAGTDPGSSAGMREAAMNLFARIARLTTAISKAGADARQFRQIETDQARGLADEVRLYSRRANLMLARPVWPHSSALVDANRIFYAGGPRMRSALAGATQALGLELADPAPTGAEPEVQRWLDLRTSSVSVFDLADESPQVYYELGIALALGAQLLLLAPEGLRLPFDVAQAVCRYTRETDLHTLLTAELDAACYGMQVRPAAASGLPATLAYAERIAAANPTNLLAAVALKTVRIAGTDPVSFGNALGTFNSYLGSEAHALILPRWPGSYPDPAAPRCFAIMPFRPAQEPAHAVVASEAGRVGVRCVRGDVADGQQIIESIWQEICRATHITVDLSGFNPNVCLELGIANTLGRRTLLIGIEGTASELKRMLPNVAKWRCHTYAAGPDSTPEFRSTLRKFFMAPYQAARRQPSG
jgi:hypothetical protein